MSKWKWMLGSVPLFLAIAPVATAEESAGGASEVQAVAPECAPDHQSTEADARRIEELQAQVKKLQAEVAARSALPPYLDQDDPFLP